MAIEFDGADDYVDIGSGATIDNIFDGGGTLAVWIYPDTFGEGNLGTVSEKLTGSVGWLVFVRNTGGAWVETIQFTVRHSTANGAWESGSNTVSLGVWTHLVVTYNDDSSSNNPYIYLDGVSQTIVENDSPSGTYQSDAAEALLIGNRGAQDQSFDGKMDDYRLFDYILTQEQISILASGDRSPIGGEICWLSCDDFEGLAHPDGATLTAGTHYLLDKSTNDNRGNPTGGVVARASDAPRFSSWVIVESFAGLAQAVAGTLTNTGSLVKRTGKIAAGTLTNTGSLVRAGRKIVAGTLTNTGSLVRAGRKIVAGTLTNTGALVRKTSKTAAGVITNTGALATVKAVLEKLYVWTAKFRATDSEDSMHTSSDEKRSRA